MTATWPTATCLLACLLATARGLAADGAASPFLPPAAAAGAAAPSTETIEFAGVLIGRRTELVLLDKATRKSRFVAVGETVDGLQVMNYDPAKEQAVVRVNGATRTLPLRKATGPVNAPAPVPPQPSGFAVPTPPPAAPAPTPPPVPAVAAAPAPTPVAVPSNPATPPTPDVQAKQEQEARMLVSDLLEIGMAQRRAYEEAMRKQQQASPPAGAPAPR